MADRALAPARVKDQAGVTRWDVQRRRTWLLFLIPALVVYTVFMAYPLFNSMRLSFYQGQGLTPDRYVGFENYVDLFTNPLWRDRFFNAVGNTFLFFAIHMLVQNTLGLLFATLLSNVRLRGRNVYRAIIFAPATMSVLVTGFLWTLILNPRWGMLNQVLEAIGLGALAKPWLGEPDLALPVISLVSSWQWVGLPTMMFLAGLLTISDELSEAAHVDGANAWQFLADSVPLLRPTIGIVSVLTFIGNFNAFDVIYAMAGARGEPNYASDLLATFFYRTAIAGEHPVAQPNMGIGAAVATCTFLILLVGVSLWLKFGRGGEESLAADGGIIPMTRRFSPGAIASHLVLLGWSLVVLIPVWTMLINSVKPKREIFRNPFGLPSEFTFDGYTNAWTAGRFDLYFRNSLIVSIVSLLLILFLGSLAAYALANWRSRFSSLLYIYFVAGLMIPIRLGTINLLQIIISLGWNDSLLGLIPVYVAMGLPIATFVLTSFIRSVPGELNDAARIDGATEWRVYWSVTLPLIRPALATVTIFNLLPIWNDLWFPLIFIRDQQARTVTLGVSLLFGQYQTDWTRALSALSMAAVPVLIVYLLMSSQFIKGLTAGAIEG